MSPTDEEMMSEEHESETQGDVRYRLLSVCSPEKRKGFKRSGSVWADLQLQRPESPSH